MSSFTNSPTVCVIIPNYNGKENLRECLQSLGRLQYSNFGITVVDGGSNDGSCEMVGSAFRNVNLIRFMKRIGYGQAVNEAVGSCTAKYVALLDNDTSVDARWLTELVAPLEKDPTIGIAGSKVYFHDSSRELCSAGGLLNPKNGFLHVLGLGEIDRGQYDTPRFLDWVMGCAMLARRDLISRFGYVDEGYEFYREEVDLCFRARRAGYKVLFVPSSVVWHKVSQTTSALDIKFYYLHRSWIRFCLVNLRSIYAIIGAVYASAFTLGEATVHATRGRAKDMRAAVSAILWNLASLRRTLARRATVGRIISNASLDA
jgi:GT2 family glycosyltransferase